jgi:hypothetical protein
MFIRDEYRLISNLLFGFVILRLFFFEMMWMTLLGKSFTFVTVGLLLMTTAFRSKRDDN